MSRGVVIDVESRLILVKFGFFFQILFFLNLDYLNFVVVCGVLPIVIDVRDRGGGRPKVSKPKGQIHVNLKRNSFEF